MRFQADDRREYFDRPTDRHPDLHRYQRFPRFFARVFGKVLVGLLLSALCPGGFFSEQLSNKLLEDKGKPICPSPDLIVPDGMDRLGQFARTLVWLRLDGN